MIQNKMKMYKVENETKLLYFFASNLLQNSNVAPVALTVNQTVNLMTPNMSRCVLNG